MEHERNFANTDSVSEHFTKEKFFNELKKPVVLKNSLTCWKSVPWTLKEFSENYGTILFDFRAVSRKLDTKGPVWEGDAQFVKATIPQFVEWLENLQIEGNSHNPLSDYPSTEFWLYSSYNYMFQVFPEDSAIMKGVDWKTFGFEGRSGKDSTFWIGSSGAYTPCHFDTYGCNLVAQICGRKQWILFPPEDGDFLYPTRIPYEESSVFSSVDMLNPDLQSHPMFEKCHPYITTLEPGDVLFVPKQWWHFVKCVDASVSINTWIELPNNCDTQTRLEEAVARALMTSLIPTYVPLNEMWLNPNEEFVSAEKTLNYILVNLQCLNKMCDKERNSPSNILEDSKDCSQSMMSRKTHKVTKLDGCSDVRSSKLPEQGSRGNVGITVIEPTDFFELLKVLGTQDGSPNNLPLPSDVITPKDIMNCIAHPDVISLISQKLKYLCLSRSKMQPHCAKIYKKSV